MSVSSTTITREWSLPRNATVTRTRAPLLVHDWTRGPEADLPGQNSFARELRLRALLAYLTLFAALYSATYLIPYGITDSYTKLTQSLHGQIWIDNVATVEGGRPLLSLLTTLSLAPLRGYNDFRYLAMASVLGIALLAWALYQAVLMAKAPRYIALILPPMICVAPAFQVYAAWTVCAYYPYAALIGGAAAISVYKGLRAQTRGARLALWAVGLFLFIMAMLIYQPGAMMFWVFAAIFLFAMPSDFKDTLRDFITYGVIVGAGFAADFVAVKVGTALLGVTGATRSTLATDLSDKAHWFASEPLTNAYSVYSLKPTYSLAIAVFVCSCLGLAFYLNGSAWARALKFGIALLLLPLSYLPNLLVKEDWASYRTQAGLTSLVILYLCFALMAFRKAHIPAVTGLAYAALLMLALYGSYTAAKQVTLDFAVPQYEELALLHRQLESPKLANATSIYLIPSSWRDWDAPAIRYDEYGVLSSSISWSEAPMVYLVMRDIDPARADIPVTVAPPDGPYAPPPGSLVVDMRLIGNMQLIPYYH